MKRCVFAIFCLFALSFAAQATDGYVYRNGYYYYGADGQDAYSLSYSTTPGYWLCGRYYPGSRYAVYTRAYPPAAYETPKVNSIQDATKKLVTDKAAQLSMQDDVNTFVGTAKALGHNLQSPLYIPPVLLPYAPGYNIQGHHYAHYAVGGNTIYAPQPFIYNGTAFDPNAATLQANQLAQSVQDAATNVIGRAQQATLENVAATNAGNIKLAELQARHAFALELAKATYNNPQLQSQGFRFSISSDGTSFTPKLSAMPQDKRTALQKSGEAVLAAKCASCHSDGKRPFQVSNWGSMSDAQVDALIADRLLTKDAGKLMPRKAEGGAGAPLTFDEILSLKSINAK